MSDRARRSDEILGATVLVTGWSEGREDEVAEALDLISKEPVDLAGITLPYVALARVSLDKADAVRAMLEAAGASVTIEDAWVTRDAPRAVAPRPPCPFCGSTKTQPYTHAGPAARPSFKCTTCGQRFRV
ncbi:MAG TPA: hypothetical protein VFK59_11700 [Actinomycetota bacterium]|nr:hypothetical protein [Actinomycetota bacterium]